MLPIDAHRGEILAAFSSHGRLILAAPPGTGKSTRLPPMLPASGGRVAVLQPRRIAARNLACRVADEMGVELGGEVGYQVRYEGKSSERTRILFQTYGIFFRQLLENPQLEGVDTVVFDEFHERALECDASLAYCLGIQRGKRPDLKLIVMSATLESESLTRYLAPAAHIEIASPLFPVEVRYQVPGQQERPWDQALRALRSLSAEGISGSVLVFMPGVGEIRRTAEILEPWARRQGMSVHELHGGMDLSAQQRALRAPETGPAVIIATNVAETSLTLPGITAVIDSGLQRVSAFNAERDMDTLYLKSISLHSAIQRRGRAGRTAPGLCVRLWAQEREQAMPAALDPEIRRVDLTPLALQWQALQSAGEGRQEAGETASGPSGQWLDEPTPALWEHAAQNLRRIGAVRENRLTPLGAALLKWSVHPVPGSALFLAQEHQDPLVFEVAAAMAAILESDGRNSAQGSPDLFSLGRDLIRDPHDGRIDRDVKETWSRLRRLGGRRDLHALAESVESAGEGLREAVTRCFLPAFVHRLAARGEKSQTFALGDGRRGVVEIKFLPKDCRLVLALEMRETGGAGKTRQVSIPLMLPVYPEWIEKIWPEEILRETVKVWDEARGRHALEEREIFRGIPLRSKFIEMEKNEDAGEVLAEKLASGEIALPGFDDEAKQTVCRIRLAAATFPDMGFPVLDEEDWRLLYHDICEGKSSLKELEGVSVTAALREYLGYSLWSWLEREAPTSLPLPGGRRGKIFYPEKGLPELSARLGDFVGMEGKTFILQKRVNVVYDILAPNYRTVQKTQDLTSFWRNTYPEVKKELKRRYPRHPWP